MLIIFEGPDSVGKSTISKQFVECLSGGQNRVHYWTFPGRDPGTLGWLVYQLHHDPGQFRIAGMTPASLQMLHIAAHVDAIETRILPALDAGDIVVLDRFWWSTWVYGVVDGAKESTLHAMIEVERQAWGAIQPDLAFLIQRPTPFKLRTDEKMHQWQQLKVEYGRLVQRARQHHPVIELVNDSAVETAVESVTAAYQALSNQQK